METILGSKSGIKSLDSAIASPVKGVSVSAPLVPIKVEESKLKTQTSAPSYFYSLKDNAAPPFKKPGKEPKPCLLLNTVFSEDDVVELIAASEADPEGGLQKPLGLPQPRETRVQQWNVKIVAIALGLLRSLLIKQGTLTDCHLFYSEILVRKKVVENFSLSEKSFLTSLLSETIDYAAQRDFGAFKLACLLTLYTKTHLYFKWYYWQSPISTWHYFKEILIRHSVEDSPDGQEVFEPDECYDILTHFHSVYLSNLPLIHILTFGVHRLKLMWPYKPKQ